MYRVFVRHSVEDFEKWHAGYREYYPLQVELEMCGDAVHHDIEDGNRMTVVHDFATMDQVKRYMSLPNLKELMDKIGVKGEPEIWVTKRVL